MSPLPRAHGAAPARGVIRSEPEDFQVEELLGFEPDGAGEHLLVLVEKRSANTHWVARVLAKLAGVAPADVGYAGAKDRHAVARQWFSVHLAARPEPDWKGLDAEGVRVLSSARHRRKLRRGAHSGNAFRLRVRALEGERDALAARLRTVAAEGVPNYFGPQRYGHANLVAARELFAGSRLPRVQRGFALSAARSALFDAVLAARVTDATWNRLRPGDAANLAGSASWFTVDAVDAALEDRVRRMDVHPTGPLWGRGEPQSAGEVRMLERSIADAQGDFRRGLEDAGLEQARRALRVVPARLGWEVGRDEAVLGFELPPGAYATSVLRELIDAEDRGGSGAHDHETC
jgi:tRNA pseudouridine13 synthase